MAKHAARTRRRRWPWVVGGIPVLVLVLLLGAWGISLRAQHGRVARNVALAGHAVGGDNRQELDAVVAQLASDDKATPVHIAAGAHSYDTTAGALGLDVDAPATTAAVLDVDHSGFALLRPLKWIGSWFGTRTVVPRFHVDEAAIAAALPEIEGDNRTDPVEPTITQTAPGDITVVAGTSGHGIDAHALAAALLAAASAHPPGTPLEVSVTEQVLEPRFTDADAQAVADDAVQLARHQLTLAVAGAGKPLDVATVAGWMRAVARDNGLALAIDDAALRESVATLFGDTIGQPPVDATFTIEDGKPVMHPSQDGTVCCAPGSGDAVLAALRANNSSVTVGLVAQQARLSTARAAQLGISEEIGQPDMFGPTTHHVCCENRVTNIHLIADVVRGHVILPGETFSVNDFVGKRTAERGFVDAPVIYNATHAHDIGGGVSQFATTMFNAAFFAGLDLTQYQSHSLYISRYPRGREATISWPAPDLKITNSTPFGVLIWPTYDATSLTVHLYSTHFVDALAGATTDVRSGRCTKVTTPRVRVYLDGRNVEDSVFALYQPADGVRC